MGHLATLAVEDILASNFKERQLTTDKRQCWICLHTLAHYNQTFECMSPHSESERQAAVMRVEAEAVARVRMCKGLRIETMPNPAQLLEYICLEGPTTLETLYKDSKRGSMSSFRSIAVYLLREDLKLESWQIAIELQRKDNGSILLAYNRIKQKLDNWDASLIRCIARIRSHYNNSVVHPS